MSKSVYETIRQIKGLYDAREVIPDIYLDKIEMLLKELIYEVYSEEKADELYSNLYYYGIDESEVMPTLAEIIKAIKGGAE